MSDLWEELEALRPRDDPSPSSGTRNGWRSRHRSPSGERPTAAEISPAPRKPPRPAAENVIAGMAVSALLLSIGVAVGFETGPPAGQPVEASGAAVLGATEMQPAGEVSPAAAPTTTSEPATATAPRPAESEPGAEAAVPAGATSTTGAAPVTTTTVKPTTTTTRPAPTTVTTPRPAPIAPVSATATGTGVTLTLTIGPAGGIRTVDGRLSATLLDGRVLRSARVDFGDGVVLPGSVYPWACNDPNAPNPYTVSLPSHTYAGPGAYQVTVIASTAKCLPSDDDWGPEAAAEVAVTVVVP